MTRPPAQCRQDAERGAGRRAAQRELDGVPGRPIIATADQGPRAGRWRTGAGLPDKQLSRQGDGGRGGPALPIAARWRRCRWPAEEIGYPSVTCSARRRDRGAGRGSQLAEDGRACARSTAFPARCPARWPGRWRCWSASSDPESHRSAATTAGCTDVPGAPSGRRRASSREIGHSSTRLAGELADPGLVGRWSRPMPRRPKITQTEYRLTPSGPADQERHRLGGDLMATEQAFRPARPACAAAIARPDGNSRRFRTSRVITAARALPPLSTTPSEANCAPPAKTSGDISSGTQDGSPPATAMAPKEIGHDAVSQAHQGDVAEQRSFQRFSKAKAWATR